MCVCFLLVQGKLIVGHYVVTCTIELVSDENEILFLFTLREREHDDSKVPYLDKNIFLFLGREVAKRKKKFMYDLANGKEIFSHHIISHLTDCAFVVDPSKSSLSVFYPPIKIRCLYITLSNKSKKK